MRQYFTRMFPFSAAVALCILIISTDSSADDVLKGEQESASYKQENITPNKTHSLQRTRLFQYDPVQKGHVQYVEDESGRKMKLVTLATNPPVFEVPHFLTDEECDHVIKLAQENGLETSGVVSELLPSLSDGNEEEVRQIFTHLDFNEDKFLSPSEFADGLLDIAEGLLSDDDVKLVLAEFKLDINNDEQLDFEEFKDTWTVDVENFVRKWVEQRQASNDTSFRFSKTRVSDQTWLDQTWYDDEILKRLHERVIKLTQLPKEIVYSSESLQVVHYKPGGHYHAHYDSADLEEGLECSHTQYTDEEEGNVVLEDGDKPPDGLEEEEKCEGCEEDVHHDESPSRLCRYATVLFYLNDVEEGGETAFPVADNLTYSEETLANMTYDLYDLSYHCYDSNVIVGPEKGKAIIWYNHMLNETTSWMGDVFNRSLHGGCDVLKGEKWIANNWINVDDVYERQMEYQEEFMKEMENSKTLTDEEQKAENEFSERIPTEDVNRDGLESENLDTIETKTIDRDEL